MRRIEVGGPCPTRNSFDAGTLVLMADGTRKPIEDVELGDEVIATDPETGEQGPRKVIDLIRHGGLHTMVDIQLSDGSQVDATDEHPFWVESEGEWVDAINLEAGDVVTTAGGAMLTVTSTTVSQADLTAYNLTIADLHTYHVGTADVLVHNSGGASEPNPGALKKMKEKRIESLVGDVHEFKADVLGTTENLAQFDVYYDKETHLVYVMRKGGVGEAQFAYMDKDGNYANPDLEC